MQWVMSSDDGQAPRRRSWTNFGFAALTLAISSLAMACGGPEKPATTEGAGGNSSSSSSSTGGGGAGGSGGEGGMAVDMPGPVEEVMKFDQFMGELPEGIAIDGTTAYITFGSTKVITVDLEKKTRADFGSIAAPIGIGSPQGIAIDGQKNIYVAASSTDPVQFKPGIYKFPPGGGTATLFAEHVNMSYPRHMAFHSSGLMVVSIPTGARMFTIKPDGTVIATGVDETLSGDQSSACAWGEGIPYGVSSVAFDDDTLLGANADRGTIFEGSMAPDMMGNVYAHLIMNPGLNGPDCSTLGGAESMLIDPYDKGLTPFDVAMIVAARRANKITKVRYTGKVEVIADGTNLHEPSAMALTVIGPDRYLYIVNSDRKTAINGGTALPGLVRMRLGKAM